MPVRYYTGQNVLEAARERVAFIFDEFPNVAVNFSGGKDSTVVFHLALEEARKRGRLPLKVLFIDQEAEWDATVKYIRSIMTRPDVEPHWLQIPFRMFNATSTIEEWMTCWEPGKEDQWMRPREPFAKTENVYGTDRFAELFTGWQRHTFADELACNIGGVRTEESPARATGLTHYAAYKWITWGRVDTPGKHFTLYPIYDWSSDDVWAAIAKHDWPYNPIYDLQYRYGLPMRSMRVSNLHHETAVQSLWSLQEIEPETYAKLVARIGGIDMAGKMGVDDYFVKRLPPMFKDWREYRDFLLEKLIDPEHWEPFKRDFERQDEIYGPVFKDKLWKKHVKCILTNDYHTTHLNVLERSPPYIRVKRAYGDYHRGTHREDWHDGNPEVQALAA